MTVEELTLEDFNEANWQTVFDYVQTKDCSDYSLEFRSFSTKYLDEGNERAAFAMQFLGELTSIQLSTDDPNNPFGPQWVSGGRRSLIPSDYTEQQLSIIKGLSEICTDPELRARFNDVLWVTKKDHLAGKNAVDDYLESAKNLKDEHFLKFNLKVERAVHLAAMLGGKKKPLLPKCKEFILSIILESIDRRDYTRASDMLEILYNQRLESVEFIISTLETVIENYIVTYRYRDARHAIDLLVKCQYRGNMIVEASLSQLKKSKIYEDEADELARKENYLVASDYMMKSITLQRQLGKSPDELKEAYKKLANYQQNSVKEMKTISTELKIDIEEIDKIKNSVSGYTFLESLLRMTRLLNPKGKEKTEKDYDKAHEGLVFHKLLSRQIVTERGSVVGQIPAFNPLSSDEDSEDKLMMHLYQHSSQNRQFDSIFIDMMREQIIFEHHPTLSDFERFLINHPFVESGHERLYARALKAGLEKDLMICAHLLIPQIENSLRHILRSYGLNVTKINSDLTQGEMVLGDLFFTYKKELIELLGEAVYFNLRGLLITKYSSNLRNLALHGLMSDNDFENLEIIYLWWLVLRILFAPFELVKPVAEEDTFASTDAPDEVEVISEDVREVQNQIVEVDSSIKIPPTLKKGFEVGSKGTADGFWTLMLKNSSDEAIIIKVDLEPDSTIELINVPRNGLRVREGRYISIRGKSNTVLPHVEGKNPQGAFPFSFIIYFERGGLKYKQRCVTIDGLLTDFTIEDEIAI